MTVPVTEGMCAWCEHQTDRLVPIAFVAAVNDEHRRFRELGACRRHVATLLAWFARESVSGTVVVRRAT